MSWGAKEGTLKEQWGSQRTAGKVALAQRPECANHRANPWNEDAVLGETEVRNDILWAESSLRDATWPTDGLRCFKNLSSPHLKARRLYFKIPLVGFSDRLGRSEPTFPTATIVQSWEVTHLCHCVGLLTL